MAFRPSLRQRNALPALAGALAGSALFYPKAAFAESPEREAIPAARKPIYDDLTPSAPAPSQGQQSSDSAPSAPSAPTSATTPSPTDRLEKYVRSARLQLYDYSTRTETTVNHVLTRALNLEGSLTSTVRSLAPPPESKEAVMPGLIYVLVAAMAGSIITRNRGILLRSTVPLAMGVGTGHAVIPVTMRNVGDLAWSYEEKYPPIRDAHLATREKVDYFWETGKAHSAMTVSRLEEGLNEARRKMEEWVRQGK